MFSGSFLRFYPFLHRRSRRRHRKRHVRNVDRDETPTGHRTSSSDADKPPARLHLNKVVESTEEVDANLPPISCNTSSSSGIVEPDDITSKTTTSDTSSNLPQALQDSSDVNIAFRLNGR